MPNSILDSLVFTRPSPSRPEGVTDRYTFRFKEEGTIVFKMEFGIAPKKRDLVLTTTYTLKKKGGEDKKKPQVSPKRASRM